MQPEQYQKIQKGYVELKKMLSGGGGAEAAALDIISDLGKINSGRGKI
jgi:hypothetical protein